MVRRTRVGSRPIVIQTALGTRRSRNRRLSLTRTGTPAGLATGRTVFDNKGNPIKKYDPYFASDPDV